MNASKIIFLSLGAISGTLLGMLATKKYYERKCDERCDELEEYYDAIISQMEDNCSSVSIL